LEDVDGVTKVAHISYRFNTIVVHIDGFFATGDDYAVHLCAPKLGRSWTPHDPKPSNLTESMVSNLTESMVSAFSQYST